jgi:hypothetical protein
MKIYAALLGHDTPDTPWLTDKIILEQTKALPPLALIKMHRIRLLIRLSVLAAGGGAKYAISVLSSSYTAKDSWLKAVYRDIVHISKVAPKLKAMEDADLKEWTEAFAKCPKAWNNTFQAAYSEYFELAIANPSEDDQVTVPDPLIV